MAILRAEDDVDQHESERLCHGEDYRSGLQPSGSVRVLTRGVAPGWYRAGLRPSSCGEHTQRLYVDTHLVGQGDLCFTHL
jgi:hypothetical protein